MARHARIQFDGAIYHVTFRGNDRKKIFRSDSDRERMQNMLAKRVEEYRIQLYLYCFMDNHVHFLLETPNGNVSAFMGSFLTAYSTYFNRKYKRSGHLTQGRFKSPLVENNAYLLQLSRYIHLNPIHTKEWDSKTRPELRKGLRRYTWSSYPSYIGLAPRWSFIAYDMALEHVAPIALDKPKSYRKYVEQGLSEDDKELEKAMNHSPLAIGSEAFVEAMEDLQAEQDKQRLVCADVPSKKRHTKLPPETVRKAVCQHFKCTVADVIRRRKKNPIKPVYAVLLKRYCNLSQREIAPLLGVETGAAVSWHIRGFGDEAHEEGISDYDRIARRLNKLL